MRNHTACGIILILFLISSASLNARVSQDDVVRSLKVPKVEVEANAELQVEPGFENQPMYGLILGRNDVKVDITAFYFDQEIFYKTVSDAGESVVLHMPNENSSQYWYRGSNETFGGYSKKSVDTVAMAQSPYLIFNILSGYIAKGEIANIAPLESGAGFVLSKEGRKFKNDVYTSQWAVETNSNFQITSIKLEMLRTRDGAIVSNDLHYEFAFSNFDSQFHSLARTIAFQQYDSLPGKDNRVVARTATVQVKSMKSLPANADYKPYLAKLTDGMFKYDLGDKPVYRISKPPPASSTVSRWLAWGGGGFLVLAACFLIYNARSRRS